MRGGEEGLLNEARSNCVSQALTGHIKTLAERYAIPLPQLADEVACLTARVGGHLAQMGFSWN